MQSDEDGCISYLKQEGEQSYTCHIMLGLCQRSVWLFDVDYVQLHSERRWEGYGVLKYIQ